MGAGLIFRDDVIPSDRADVQRIIRSTGLFYDFEIDVAVELVDERLAKGTASGYHFLFAEDAGRVVGYACYGPIACTSGSYDLFWIAVQKDLQGRGVGRLLLEATERRIREAEGRRVYIETSSREIYRPTQGFYTSCGYALEARLAEFYGPEDDKLVYVKVL